MPRDALSIDIDSSLAEKGDSVAYYCIRCGQFVTRTSWALRMGGDHEHVLFNPAGVIFRVACFADAPGVVAVGSASGQFTWFRGYLWRVALCRGCDTHLGWMYEGTGAPAVFFGLIRTLLVERPG
ncbi:MAG: hypothetical protein HY985_14260 [Magnetospirillum sp.]|nr:hypothetical protein [Magnetospirillum sp.]